MFETLRIKLFGDQPTAKISDKLLEHLIQRDFGPYADEVKQKLENIENDSKEGKNRLSACILKLSNKDFNVLDHYINLSNNDFRDVILQAEYPRCLLENDDLEEKKMKGIYLADWVEYSGWLNQ